jgi:erythrocyte band 7 integral membrane protein
VQSQLAQAENSGEGPSNYMNQGADHEYGQGNSGFQSAINANVVEHI